MAYTFDAVWSIALMLNRTLQSGGIRSAATRGMTSLDVDSETLHQLFFDGLAETNFFGASVRNVSGKVRGVGTKYKHLSRGYLPIIGVKFFCTSLLFSYVHVQSTTV